jgi:nucleoid-associated protein YgaU
MSLLRTVRLLVGLAFVAGGVTLAAPLAGRLIAAAWPELAGGRADAPASVAVVPAETLAAASMPVAVPMDAAVLPEEAPAGPSVVPVQPPVALPPARTALPPWAVGWEATTPNLGPAYRSALESPPPPLLDEAGPATRSRAVFTGLAQPAVPFPDVSPSTEPSTYRVRDGDDLAGIATRFYGDPNAAAALWAANQDTLRDPSLLPIGATLRLPPQWSVVPGPGTAIEPRAAAAAP